MSSALAEILENGMRAWAKGFAINFRGRAYGVYFVQYKSTLHENKDGRWN